MQFLTILAIAYGSALALTPLIKQMALVRGWLDLPNEARKLHRQPMVRLGGVAIALALSGALLALWLLSPVLPSDLPSHSAFFSQPFYGLVLGGLGFFLIGAVDDIFPLSPFHRLALQGLASGLAWRYGVRLEYLPLPGSAELPLGLLGLPVTLIWLAGVANAVNWLDGLDGLASSVVITVELTIFGLLMLMNGDLAVSHFCIALIGATLGFLYHNAHPAKLFMGDGGSYLLGFALGGTSLLIPYGQVNWQSALVPFVLLALPILDMTRVIVRRLSQGHSPFYPDRGHIHHLLLDSGFSQRETVSLIVSLSLCLSTVAVPLAGVSQGWLLVMVTSLYMLLQWAGCIRHGLEAAVRAAPPAEPWSRGKVKPATSEPS